MMLKRIILILTVALVVSGCLRDPKPKQTISREKFINVLTDMHIGEALYQERKRLNLDSLQSKPIYLGILKKYHVSEDQMLNTTLYYSRHPREYDKVYTEVISRMQRMNEDIQGVKKTNDKQPMDKQTPETK